MLKRVGAVLSFLLLSMSARAADLPAGATSCGSVTTTLDQYGGYYMAWVPANSCFKCGIKYYPFGDDLYAESEWDKKVLRPKSPRNIATKKGSSYVCTVEAMEAAAY